LRFKPTKEEEDYLNEPLSHHDKEFIKRTIIDGIKSKEICLKNAKTRKFFVNWLFKKLCLRNCAWILFTTIGGRRKYKLWKSFDAYLFATWIGPAMEW